MRKIRTRLYKNRLGQATTELAIFGFILLIAFAGLLKYGQVMNKQQEIRMHAFRQALEKAYYGYGGGSGFGAASYTAIKNVHVVSPFRTYYDGSQRTGVSGGATVMWDPDMMYLEEGDAQPNSYVEVDGIERNLGTNSVKELYTNSTVNLGDAVEEYQANAVASTNSDRARTDEHLVTNVATERGRTAITQDNTYQKNETWVTPW